MTHGIGIDLEEVLVEGRVDSDDVPHLMVNLEFQGSHGSVEVNSVEVSKEEDLRVSLSSVSRLRPFRRLSNLDDDHVAVSGREKGGRRVSKNDSKLKENENEEAPRKLTERRDLQTRRDQSRLFRS